MIRRPERVFGRSPRMTRRRLLRTGAVPASLLILVLNAADVTAQLSVGLHGDWGSDTGVGAGIRGIVGMASLLERLELMGYADTFFPDDVGGAGTNAWEAGVNLVYRLRAMDQSIVPYAGIGLSYARFDVSAPLFGTDIGAGETTGGVNVLAGLVWTTGRVSPFLEGRLLSSDAGQVVIAAGGRVRLSGP